MTHDLSILLMAVAFNSLPVLAGPRTEGALTTKVKGAVLSAQLKEGFHFNGLAPNSVSVNGQSFKPTMVEGREAEFASLPANWKTGKATFYICDDAVTFCEPYSLEVGQAAVLPPPDSAAPDASGPSAWASSPIEGNDQVKLNKFSFIENDYNHALSQAKKERKLILIDFSARWCPGCQRLEDEILPAKSFQKLVKTFIRLKIDMDRFENSVVSEKFKVNVIPTLLVVNADQKEIDRIVDYQPMEVLTRFFSAIKADPADLERLKVRARKKDPKVLLRLGKRLMASGRYGDSLVYLNQIRPPPPELLEAQVQAANAEKDGSKTGKAKYAETLRRTIEAEPESLRSLNWRIELLGVTEDQEEKTDVKNDGISIADDFLKDREAIIEASKGAEIGEFAGFERFMVGILRAELIEASGASQAATSAAWEKAAEVARELKIPASRTGLSMRRLIVLTQAKLFDEAEKLATDMSRLEPENFEIKRRRLRILMELGNFDLAIKLGKEVLEKSYGRYEFWVAESLVKALAEAKRGVEARDLLGRYLSRTELDWPNMKGTRKRFEELNQKIPRG
jgi:thioredoxin-like negative regulator of GroEL